MTQPNGYPQGGPYYAPQTATAPQRAEVNPWSGRALAYGIFAVVITIIAGFLGRYVIGVLAFYAVYASIRGLIVGIRLSTHKGLIPSIFGLLLSLFALFLTLLFATGIMDALAAGLSGN